MAPLSGIVGLYGEEIANAGRIACQEINARGGVLGRELELVIVDDGSLPETAVPAAVRLVEEEHCVALIGSLLSSSRIDVAYKVAEPRRIPYLNFSFYEGSIYSRYFFHFAALPNQQIERMIPYMVERYGLKIFFAGSNYEWPRGSIHAAKLSLQSLGGEIVGERYFPLGAADIDDLLSDVARSGADIFVPYFAGEEQIRLLTEFTRLKLKERMKVVMGHYDEAMVSKLAPDVREGFFSSNTYFMDVDTPENEAYLKQLRNLPGVDGIWPEGKGMLTNFGEGTYVCVHAFAKAANAVGSVTAEALIKGLEHVTVRAPQGEVSMDPVTHHAKVNSYLSRCTAEGRFELLESFGAISPLIPDRYKHQRLLETLKKIHQPLEKDEDEEQLKHMDYYAGQAIAYVNMEGVITFANSQFLSLWQAEHVDEVILKSFAELLENGSEMTALIGKQSRWRRKVKAKFLDGSSQELELSFKKISAHSDPSSSYLVMAKLPESLALAKKLQKQLMTSRLILSAIDVAIIATDVDGVIIETSKAVSTMFGYRKDELLGTSVHLLLPPHRREMHRHFLKQFISSKDMEVELSGRGQLEAYHKDGSIFPVRIGISKYRTTDGWLLLSTLHDISEKVEAQARMSWLATHDPLTKLPNRRLILERLDRALGRASRAESSVALLMLDLDNFKLINDSFGHEVGDKVLQGVSEVMMARVSPGDTVARLSGDQFMILCEKVGGYEQVVSVASNVLDALHQPLEVDGNELCVSASIGVAYSEGQIISANELISNADVALSGAKGKGKQGWQLFCSEDHRKAVRQLKLANGLRYALEKDEFSYELQPIMDGKSGRLVGTELLLRWQNDEGDVSPAEFIPIAEASKSILNIGLWVLKQACEIQRTWQDKKLIKDLPYISVNLSASQLNDASLPGQFLAILEETGANPELIALEVTETSLMADVNTNMDVLNKLGSMGFRIAIDDFGTGYSSLSQLSQMRVNNLKIDRSFVEMMDKGKREIAIITAIVSMAHSLGLTVIAEGVETLFQWQALEDLRCDYVQGYYFDKPLPREAFEEKYLLNAGKILDNSATQQNSIRH